MSEWSCLGWVKGCEFSMRLEEARVTDVLKRVLRRQGWRMCRCSMLVLVLWIIVSLAFLSS